MIATADLTLQMLSPCFAAFLMPQLTKMYIVRWKEKITSQRFFQGKK